VTTTPRARGARHTNTGGQRPVVRARPLPRGTT
jgi:hypothetical protein